MDAPLSCEPVDHAIRGAAAPRPGWLAALVDRWMDWRDRLQQRRDLAALSGHMLKDIGLSGADVDAELRKRPWQD